MSTDRVVTGDLRVAGRYVGFVAIDALTGWEHGAIETIDGEVDRDMDGNPIYPVGATFDNPPSPDRIFDTLTGDDGMLATIGKRWNRAITMRRDAADADPLLEEWVRIGDPTMTENGFDQFETAVGDIAKKVRNL